jgi:hypothetical protein
VRTAERITNLGRTDAVVGCDGDYNKSTVDPARLHNTYIAIPEITLRIVDYMADKDALKVHKTLSI